MFLVRWMGWRTRNASHIATFSLPFLVAIQIFSLSVITAQWVQQNSTTTEHLQGVSFVDSLHGWVVGARGVVLHTTNGGDLWVHQISGTTSNLEAVSFCDTLNGWATGYEGTILKTSDGGDTWTHLMHDTSFNIRHFDVQCLTPTTTYVLRDSFEMDFYTNHRIWKTVDGGSSWLEVSPRENFYSALRDMHFISPSHGWTCGFGGVALHGYQIHRTTDGGMTWFTYYFNAPTLWSMQKVHLKDTLEGWATDWTTIYHSTDGGVTWIVAGTPQFNNLSDLVMFGTIGYASRTIGRIKKTTDGGLTWSEQSSAPANYIEAIDFVAPEIGWAVGWHGQIVHTENGGVTSINAEDPDLPHQFLLEQNYPNPFNPSTTIRYQLSTEAVVTLKVYNLLGQVVATLVNEEKEAGSYQVQFDATGLASGVYFYRLRAGEYVETKKLVLLR